MPGVRVPRTVFAAVAGAAALGAATTAGGAQEPPPGSPPVRQAVDDNPCITASARRLYCPDLLMSPPSDLTPERTDDGRLLLRAKNSIDSRGTGPAELRGRRTGPNTMRAVQGIHRVGGGVRLVETGAMLGFKSIPGQYRYWKFRDAARFELWEIDEQNRRVRLVRTGPKIYYCLRDLVRTLPMARSPRRRVYPRCSQNKRERRVTLGTSVGWSDVYPASYHEQWIDVTGLSGRFAYVHIADPLNGIFESNEDNNEAETLVSLPTGQVIGSDAPLGNGGSGTPPDYR
jgi:hypothetical protein